MPKSVKLGFGQRLKIIAISAGASGFFIAAAIFLKNLMIRLWPGWDLLSEIATDFAIICFATLIFMVWALFLRLRKTGE